jgi:hypothetical protein
MAWSRSAIARSGGDIAAIFASTSLSSPARSVPDLAALTSLARSRIAANSSCVNRSDVLALEADLFTDFGVGFAADFF